MQRSFSTESSRFNCNVLLTACMSFRKRIFSYLWKLTVGDCCRESPSCMQQIFALWPYLQALTRRSLVARYHTVAISFSAPGLGWLAPLLGGFCTGKKCRTAHPQPGRSMSASTIRQACNNSCHAVKRLRHHHVLPGTGAAGLVSKH